MREDLRKIIEDNWEDIQELIIEKAEAEQIPKTIWDLKKEDGKEYYVLWADGRAGRLIFNSQDDEVLREIGNAFLTREEAEFELERRKIEVIMKKYSRPFISGKSNHCITYDRADEHISFGPHYKTDMGIPYFENAEVIEKVIDEIGEDKLKKYWFRVE